MGIPFTVGFACDAVEEFCGTIRSHNNFCTVFGDQLYAVTKSMTWDGHRFYVHVYYDSFKADLDEKFFFIKETPVRGVKAEYNEEAIAEHKRSRIGWFVLATNDIKDTDAFCGSNGVTDIYPVHIAADHNPAEVVLKTDFELYRLTV